MQIASTVYRQYLASRGNRRKIWSCVRQVLIKVFRDPDCSMVVHGACLKLPLSHSLPDYLQRLPNYDRLPHRISEYVHQHRGQLICVDIGANIGDTIASFYAGDGKQDMFLAVEPNPAFGRFLAQNWGWNANVTLAPVLCSSSSSSHAEFTIQEKNGTASIVQTQNGVKLEKKTLDELVCDYPFAINANVVKIDTDGHDFEVIAGSEELLSSNLPFLLFECDVFANSDYVENCLRTLRLLKRCGYNQFLLYDNFGYLMGKYMLSDVSAFRNLLFFQLISRFYYFDVLAIRDEDIAQFYRSEVAYFSMRTSSKSLSLAAIAAANL